MQRLPLPSSGVISPSPYGSWRPYQKETTSKARNALNDGNNVIISAPVGSGKSLINIKIAEGRTAYYVVSTKNLQDQIADSFKGNVAVLKGRDNYVCRGDKNLTCANCLRTLNTCPVDKTDLHCSDCELMRKHKCPCAGCYYDMAKDDALHSDMAVVNTSLLLTASFLKKREVIIVDEAHLLEQTILSHVKVTFREDTAWYKSLTTSANLFAETGNKEMHFDEYIILLTNILDDIREQIRKLDVKFAGIRRWDKRKSDLLKTHNRIEKLANKIAFLLNDYDMYEEPWVVVKEKTYDKRIHKYVSHISFLPISARRFLGRVLTKGEQFILSSATPPDPMELGKHKSTSEISTIEVPSTFPKEHRPIILDYAGRMGMKYRNVTIPKMAHKIEFLSADDPAIVHCHSYKIATSISENFSSSAKKKCILQKDRDRDLERFKNEGGIFLSVNMNDGISLDDDLCRVNILAKIPFPNLKDAQVEARRKRDGDWWMNRQVAREITQAYGRSTRSKDDWSRFYILDGDFVWFYKRNIGNFPKWFTEATVGNGFKQQRMISNT